MNRLAGQSSPYLLQHADNPVHWYPWGEAAFARARAENKPIFLSVGYSTCYWCHVMEKESFSDAGIARQLNDDFIAIKVDREERPDVDSIYMLAVQLMTGRGGWPMSVFLTPDLKPFFGGTYFPRESFSSLLERLQATWKQSRDEVEQVADQLAARMRQENTVGAGLDGPIPDPALIAEAVSGLKAGYDAANGGFGGAPKFPQGHHFDLLLDLTERGQGDESLREMVHHSLRQMAAGGIHDHLGGGFHRYSVDAEWSVPHFEKMLYNQAQMLRLYARAWQHSRDPLFRHVAEGIAAFVARQMTDASGLFYSALDAQVDYEEGKSYVWHREELQATLSAEEYALLETVYGLDGEPNFEHGRWVLRWAAPVRDTAQRLGIEVPALLARLDPIHARLRTVREQRPQPRLDDKSVTAWNGMMIDALAEAGAILQRDDYIDRAARAAEALQRQLHDDDGALLHVARQGQARLDAYLEDYAALALGLWQLAEVDDRADWAARAQATLDQMIDRLWDPASGGFFHAPPEVDHLLVNTKESFDGALPAGNSLAVRALVHSAARGKPRHAGHAADTLRAFRAHLQRQPVALTEMLRGLADYHSHALPASAKADRRGSTLPNTASLLQASAQLQGRELAVRLDLAASWHVNANPASLDFLIPTTVTPLADEAPLDWSPVYPAGNRMESGLDEPVRVYPSGTVIGGTLRAEPSGALRVRVHAQACNDSGTCLPPATLEIPVHRVAAPPKARPAP